jgi:hypothetical protein
LAFLGNGRRNAATIFSLSLCPVFSGLLAIGGIGIVGVLPENTYNLIFLNFFGGDVNLVSSVIVAAEEEPEP